MVDRRRQQLAATRIAALAVLSVGGNGWAVTRATGDGQTAPVSTATAGRAIGLLATTKAEGLALSGPGQPAPAPRWQFTRTDGIAVASGDVLAGADGVRCRLASRTAITLTETWEAERL